MKNHFPKGRADTLSSLHLLNSKGGMVETKLIWAILLYTTYPDVKWNMQPHLSENLAFSDFSEEIASCKTVCFSFDSRLRNAELY